MKALKIAGLIFILFVVAIVILGVLAPTNFNVERSIVIQASKEVIFPHVQYWKNWQAWLPWAAMDSTITAAFEGMDGEQGAKYSWSGKITGRGEMVNTGVKPGEQINYHLHFIEPWESESEGFIRLTDVAEGTKASWAFLGKNPFPWNVLNLFMNMDEMLGKDFEQGLNRLKSIVEGN